MKTKQFLQQLSVKDRLIYSSGLLLEKMAGAIGNFSSLKGFRNELVDIGKRGFSVSLSGQEVLVRKADRTISLRRQSSDLEVFKQVFLHKEYAPVVDFIRSKNYTVNQIVDVGSNVGLASCVFLEAFPAAKIICVEPDPENFKQLQKNLAPYGGQVSFLNNALWHTNEPLFLDFGFRDGKDWSRSVSKDKKSSVSIDAIDFETLLEKSNLSKVDLLKIDIEGAEMELFQSARFVELLNSKVKFFCIEIHDERHCRPDIEAKLQGHFEFFTVNETTFGYNKFI